MGLNNFITRYQDIFRFMLVLLTVFLILIWLPQGGKFKYEFTKNKPWAYEDLFAPFQFAIKKSQQDIDAERQEIIQNFKPFYRYHSTVADRNIESFITRFRESMLIYKERVLRFEAPEDSAKRNDPLAALVVSTILRQDSIRYITEGVEFLERSIASPHRRM
ncbi:MAG: hypothetical protein IIA45_09185 [Bacteroidetes bacterium]|nr:hypothetical protein [Bacteroidota bacterium]